MIKYNKKYQKLFNISIENYMDKNGKYIVIEENGNVWYFRKSQYRSISKIS